MRYTKAFGYVLLAVLLVSTVPCGAEAASIKIQPHQFKPVDPSDPNTYQEPAHLYSDPLPGGDGQAQYYAVVNVPVGRRITKVVLYHRGAGSQTVLLLDRVQTGQNYQDMATLITTENTSDNVVPVVTTTIDHPLVRAGYTYYVRVVLYSGNYVHGVKVKYQ